jgi:8-oxo-dGTP pyrophosphatase MutT (NUDIX family)
MTMQLHKYWHDIILPIIRREVPPTIPQAVVLHDNQVLLVKRDSPALWELPGGKMLPDESPERAVVREVYEETGIHVDISELLGWYERTGFRAHHAPVYLCRQTGGRLQPQLNETTQVRYFALQALPHGMFPWYRELLLQDCGSAAQKPLRRVQHLGIRTVLHCLYLDIAGRLGFLD